MKCGTGNQCLARDAVDCGGGKSCPAGNVCVKGGAECQTPAELAEQAAERKREAEEKAAAIKAAKEQAAAEKIAAQKAAAEKAAADKAAAAKAAAEKAAADKAQAEAKRAAEEQLKAEQRKDIGSIKPTSVRQSIAAWNSTRMRKAKPLPLPEVSRDSFKVSPVVPPVQPSSPQTSSSQFIRASSKSGPSYTVPLEWAGKIFFTTTAGDKVCSGQFIAPRIVLTAAHCVRDYMTGTFYDSLTFALQYQGGQFSHKYGAECVATPAGWVQPSEERYASDYALLLTDKPSLTGNFGWQSDWDGSYDSAHKVGYPVDIASGEIIQVDQGPLIVHGPIVELKHGNPLNREGSSGGAWVGRYSASTKSDENYVISVSSFIHTDAPEVAYGPYFDHDFVRLLQYVNNGCP